MVRRSNLLWGLKDSVKKSLVGTTVFEITAEFVGNNLFGLILENTEEDYVRTVNDVDIKMKKPAHFSEILTEKPLEGYIKQANIGQMDKVIDAGAYPGEFTVYAAKKGAEVIALEPDPRNADELRENVRINGLEEKVTVIEKGLWKERTTSKMERDQVFGLGSKLKKSGKMTVQLEKLDNIAERFGKIDFVKMDIEGAEIEALKGADKIVDNYSPEFAIASYHLGDSGEKTFVEVEEILQNYGYDARTGHGCHLTTYAEDREEN